MSSTDLVLVNGDLAEAEAEQLAAAIEKLGQDGDAVGLKQVAGEIDARVQYFKRQELGDAIARGIRLKALAEAEMGALLLRGEWPDDLSVSDNERSLWQAFAVGRRRGALEKAVTGTIEAETFSSTAIYLELRRSGALYVPNGALREAFESSGLSVAEVARRAGVGWDAVRALVGCSSRYPRGGGLSFRRSEPIARALGIEPTTLPQHTRSVVGRSKQYRFLRRQALPTGGRWDDAYLKFRAALQAYAKVAGEGARYDDAYGHWYALEKSISSSMRIDLHGPHK